MPSLPRAARASECCSSVSRLRSVARIGGADVGVGWNTAAVINEMTPDLPDAPAGSLPPRAQEELAGTVWEELPHVCTGRHSVPDTPDILGAVLAADPARRVRAVGICIGCSSIGSRCFRRPLRRPWSSLVFSTIRARRPRRIRRTSDRAGERRQDRTLAPHGPAPPHGGGCDEGPPAGLPGRRARVLDLHGAARRTRGLHALHGRVLAARCAKAGIAKGTGPHALRHHYASLLISTASR